MNDADRSPHVQAAAAERKPEWAQMLELVLLCWIAIFGMLTWIAAVIQYVRLI